MFLRKVGVKDSEIRGFNSVRTLQDPLCYTQSTEQSTQYITSAQCTVLMLHGLSCSIITEGPPLQSSYQRSMTVQLSKPWSWQTTAPQTSPVLRTPSYSSFPHPFDLLPRNYAYAFALYSWLILSVFCGQSLSESSTWFILNRRNHLTVEASSHSRLQGSQKSVDHKQYSKVLQAYPRFSLPLKLKLLRFFPNKQSLVLQVRFWGTEGPTGFMNS